MRTYFLAKRVGQSHILMTICADTTYLKTRFYRVSSNECELVSTDSISYYPPRLTMALDRLHSLGYRDLPPLALKFLMPFRIGSSTLHDYLTSVDGSNSSHTD